MVDVRSQKGRAVAGAVAMVAGVGLFLAGFATWAPIDPCPKEFASYPEGTVIQCSGENGPTAASWALHSTGLAIGLLGVATAMVSAVRVHPEAVIVMPAGRKIRRPFENEYERTLAVALMVAFAVMVLVNIGLRASSDAADYVNAIALGLFVALSVQLLPVAFWMWVNQPPLRRGKGSDAAAPQS